MIRQVQKTLLKFERVVERQRYWRALRDTLTLLFPFVLIGAYVSFLNQAIFQRNGFLNHIYGISRWFPGFKRLTTYTTMLNLSINGIIAVIAAFAAANFVARSAHRDNLLAGLTAAISFMMLNINYNFFSAHGQASGSRFLENNLGTQGIFLALLVGLLTGWFFSHLARRAHSHQELETQTHLLARARNNWVPMVVALLVFSLLGYGLSFVSKGGLNGLFYAVFTLPFSNPGAAILAIVGVASLSNLYWLIGIMGPVDFSGNSATSTVQNLEYALQHGSAWGAPNPVTLHTLFDAFANVGGPGMTLALLIAILWRSRNHNYRLVAKTSALPVLFNLNQPLLVGLPIAYSPLLAIPFLLAPLASMVITWCALKLQWMPPVVYPVSKTMPGFLTGWLGTGGDWRALLVSLINIAVATAIYLPFILLANQVDEGAQADA
ncbi:PTS transporter subunit EIIC [Lactiplantibacillus paraplantarum]|uniref:Permease IIC component n=1 Tax=Lactiplantibacillus paraplantarum TaxID=60520 RepID=A0AAD0TNA0_9LACO|nr:PTS transporter subunit EIIC [Lactiplantibacillus paraplantarum]AVW09948.1 PTS sugar transporter subunit IIC [Lactiplantibacillus paraplantarum]AYJ38209.1 PTS sugar transporter subunit IIC [Lactiplantibacillus paraplantarum]ERL45019.1 cellobiose PTS, EIIC [Lactiplantibacillus paraplantarum]KRL46190.1 cellobiose PTS, EIIC [Lactiplantibacillus paraplantarum DSM 10667]MCU4683176.1 PTS transporter subunit EIIC [Lactiplantibacillus paraplantarum]